ncbi:MAG: electron transfer flavoprotein subunit beta/FixA family protein [Peptococcaceae bacterium]|jgi:electron transfer flavoprotein beta subunit|nr:electron transfer flavoprotein subunit beta/FixA family protein [Peptococcaceae bacterium]MDH7525031.1 electron transfer flavoprotein subunit beta/FixA family protein [Peptococcaceae bacterium]
MRIGVCIKGVLETTADVSGYGNAFKYVMNAFDEYALEEALRIKEKQGGVEVVALTIGNGRLEEVLYSALALGAERAVHVVNEDGRYINGFGIASIIKNIVLMEKVDLVLMGKQSVDNSAHQVGGMLAGLLGWPQAIDTIRLQVKENEVIAERLAENGNIEVIRAGIPCVVGVTRGINEPRYPSLKGVISARKKEVKRVRIEELAVPGSVLYGLEIERIHPVEEKSDCRFVEGEPGNAAAELVRILREIEKVL